MAAKVNGSRICKNCKGICHTNSWRRTTGQRKQYFCSDGCLRNFTENRIYNDYIKPKAKANNIFMTIDETRFTDEEWREYRKDFYEPVEVITKQSNPTAPPVAS